MNEREMFLKSFSRPANYFSLTAKEQWQIDADLGILDWEGSDLSEEDLALFHAHYEKKESV